jgi:glutathione S-transferase
VEDRFTLADISVVSPLATMAYAGCPVTENHPRTASYVAAICARPSFARWIEREKAFLGA